MGANSYPGMMFGLAKDKMERTKLWKIVKKMPKGALLHTHMDALVDLEFIFTALQDTPGMHIFCEHGLPDPKSLEFAPLQFKFLKSEHCK
jgi:adenosine deaminase CECR1